MCQRKKESETSGDGSNHFNKEEWMDKMRKVKTTEEFTELVKELPLTNEDDP